ncbi:G patch domain-containing protein 11 [Cyphellophora attinorum]|uniref:G patch domain-containing protein 11 n=1 Tax=Cyphellophora attinorum TaxID=1664694 RepID=A0A0N0NRU8_9EURO|nr:G patch domain-containing protein 11 [Phialophora attinorum]KPI45249.1 G patch domain-containing protein 11 [Phialophora attinorum]
MAILKTPEQAADDEDDYLTMTFEDTSSSKRETLTEKKKRQAREAEIKGRPKSKAELAAEEKARREEALNTSQLDPKSKGFKMMAALGYKPGTALGVARESNGDGQPDDRLLEPIGVEVKSDRGGIGADAEKKRKFREEAAALNEDLKKRKVDEGDFRERQQQEREEKRMTGQIFGAMKVCERLDDGDRGDAQADPSEQGLQSRPLLSINVLWRGLVKEKLLKERDRRMRYDLHQSLSRRPTYDDPDEDEDDKLAMGKKPDREVVDLDLDQDDAELDDFEALPVAEKLSRLVSYLRERWHYCFWCKYQYPDESMDGCPGLTEEEHG